MTSWWGQIKGRYRVCKAPSTTIKLVRRQFLLGRILFVLGITLIMICFINENRGALALTDDSKANLLAEALGVGVAIILADVVFTYANYHRTRPARYAALLDVIKIHQQCCRLWLEMARSAKLRLEAENRHDETKFLADPQQQFLDPRIGALIGHLSLDDGGPAYPQTQWRDYLHRTVCNIQSLIGQAIERYALFLEPDVIELLIELENTSLFDVANDLPRRTVIEQQSGSINASNLDCGSGHRVDDFVEGLRRIGLFIKRDVREFKGKYGIPDDFDPDCRWALERLRGGVTAEMPPEPPLRVRR